MTNKVILITGGNTGIGFATVEQLAEQGHEVILACRNKTKAEQAIEDIIRRLPDAKLTFKPLDLGSLEDVRTFSETIIKEYPVIDVLINNAGAFPTKQQYTQDGFEFQFGVNYLGHFLLSHLLLDNLADSSDPRIIHVSSIMHTLGKIDFDSFKGRDKYSATSAYAQSKLANLMFSNELSRRLQGKIKSNAMHPGGVDSDIYRDFPNAIYKMMRIFLISPDRAGKYIRNMATHSDWLNRNGEFVVAHGPRFVSPRSKNKSISARLYDESCRLCGIQGI